MKPLRGIGECGVNTPGWPLRGTKREEVEHGQVLCKPGSVKPHTKFKAEAYILTKKKADAIRRSSPITGRNSIPAPPT